MNVRQILGSELPLRLQEEAKLAWIYRYTGDHIPIWALEKSENGLYCPVHFKDDTEWLANTRFWVFGYEYLMLLPRRSSESNPTFPLGKEFTAEPFTKEKLCVQPK